MPTTDRSDQPSATRRGARARAVAPPQHGSAPSRAGAGEFVRQTGIVWRRQMRMNLRNPAWVIIGLAQPVLYLLFFGPLLEPIAGQIGAENAYTFFVPGLLVQLGLFGALFAGFGLIAEWREGVVEAERVTPASRTALLLGRVLRDVVLLAVQGVVLVSLSFAFGLRASVGGMLLGLLLVMIVGAACSAASNALALTTKSEDVMAPVLNSIVLPVLLLSGILLPISTATGAPQWLVSVSSVIPTRYVVDAVRAVFADDWSLTVVWGVLWALGAVRRRRVRGDADVPQGERLTVRRSGSRSRLVRRAGEAGRSALRVVGAGRLRRGPTRRSRTSATTPTATQTALSAADGHAPWCAPLASRPAAPPRLSSWKPALRAGQPPGRDQAVGQQQRGGAEPARAVDEQRRHASSAASA